jgi:hypothetical protein
METKQAWHFRKGRVPVALVLATAWLVCCAAVFAQSTPGDTEGHGNYEGLPPDLAAALQRSGARLLGPVKRQVAVSGTVTDGRGRRTAQIGVQAPGQLSYDEQQNRRLTFDGTAFRSRAGRVTVEDDRIFESLLSHFPDVIALQVASGGTLRRLGGHFRTDDGTTPNYAGPYWTVYAFSPAKRDGLTRGKTLQQDVFIALDEKTGLIAEIRVVANSGRPEQTVTETQLNKWFQQSGQWFPGQIVRLEDGKEVLRFDVEGASVTDAMAPSAFQQ